MTDPESGTVDRSRRSVLAIAGAGVGIVGVSSSGSRAQTTTESDGEAQIQTRVVIPRVGEPFQGEYVGQFLIFTDPTPRDDVSPQIVGECAFAEWEPEETRGYQGLLLDRLQGEELDEAEEDPQGTEVSMYTNGNEPRVEVGTVFIVNGVEPCGEDFLGLELESVPAERFQPDYSTVENPLVGEEPGPTVSPAPEGQTDGPGQPGLSFGAALLGIGTAVLLKRVLGRSSE